MYTLVSRLALVVGLLLIGFTAMAQELCKDPLKAVADVQALVGKQDGADALILKPGDKVAFMGDSITAGGGYVRLAQYIVNAKFPEIKPTFINAGISGNKAENMQPRFERDMRLADKPAVCFINVGINDVWHRLRDAHNDDVLAAYKANVEKMVDAAQAVGAQVVLLTPTVIQEDAKNEGNTRLLKYVDAMKQVSEAKKCKFVDLHSMFVVALAAKPAGKNLTGDGVHMALYGDAVMALGVLRGLGVSDATSAAVDLTGAFQVRGLGMSLAKAAELLEVPASRFFKPELARLLGF
jgi:lysophospholipase L1-like esterase